MSHFCCIGEMDSGSGPMSATNRIGMFCFIGLVTVSLLALLVFAFKNPSGDSPQTTSLSKRPYKLLKVCGPGTGKVCGPDPKSPSQVVLMDKHQRPVEVHDCTNHCFMTNHRPHVSRKKDPDSETPSLMVRRRLRSPDFVW